MRNWVYEMQVEVWGGAAGGVLGGAVSPVSFCIQNSSGWVQKLMMCQQFS